MIEEGFYAESTIEETRWMQQYLDVTANKEYQEAKKRREAKPLKRNQFGEILFSQACEYCTEHYETVDTCDLCNMTWPFERLHKNMTVPDWKELLFHNCQYTKNVLQLLLKKVVL